MAITTLDGVDSLASISEARKNLGNVIRVLMAKTELSVLIIFTHSVDVTLHADEESEIVATRDTVDLDLIAEGHPDWVAHFLALSCEWPGKRFACCAGRKRQTASSCNAAHFQFLLGEEV